MSDNATEKSVIPSLSRVKLAQTWSRRCTGHKFGGRIDFHRVLGVSRVIEEGSKSGAETLLVWDGLSHDWPRESGETL